MNYGYNTSLSLQVTAFFLLIKTFKLYDTFYISMPQYTFSDSSKKIKIGKIICLARTYREHAKEMKTDITEEPLLFLKPDTSVIFNHGTILFPTRSSCLHHEVELGVIIKKKGKDIAKNKAMDYVLGYLVALDITARDIQTVSKKNGWPWTIAKGFDTFAPLSDAVGIEKVPTPLNLAFELKINGVVKQQANTNQMIFSLEQIISFISEIMTLNRGDLILTGTPEGVGEIKHGDILEASLGSVCSLTVNVQ